jgi:hypothetical protein
MPSKLWILGDSYFTRCIHAEQRLPNSSWTEHFAHNIGLEPKYYWAVGGTSNTSILLGLEQLWSHKEYNCDSDQVLCGFTTTVRGLMRGNSTKRFDHTVGIDNLREDRVRHTELHHLTPNTPKGKAQIAYYEQMYSVDYEQYIQHMLIDGAIGIAKTKGMNIIPHTGVLDFHYWNLIPKDFPDADSCKDVYNWCHGEMFDAPSLLDAHHWDWEQRLNKGDGYNELENWDINNSTISMYSNHISPEAAEVYAHKYTEYHNDR